MMRLAIALVSASLFVAATVAAQDREEEVTTYDFNDHVVPGERATPWMDRIPSRLPGSRQTLIRPRAHFIPEVLRSVERL